MASSSANQRLAGLCGAWVLCLGAGTLPAAQTPPQQEQKVQLDAVSGEFDYRNNTALLHDVSLKQGDIEIKAREALATGDINNFQDNKLTFRKEVKITTLDGWLLSESAEVTFRDNRMVRAVIVGAPATFERRVEDGQGTARGRAGTIIYDVAAETVRLQEDAYFDYGGKDISAQNVLYNLRNDTVFADGGQRDGKNGDKSKPVRITIDPEKKPTLPK